MTNTLCTLGIAIALAASALGAPAEFYVAFDGNDAWSGKRAAPNAAKTDGPFATLERARDAVRRLKAAGLPEGGAIVTLRAGTYERGQTFNLTKDDSGAPGSPIVYRARPGEAVQLVGGRVVRGWKPVSDPAVLNRLDGPACSNVLQTDLRAQGITALGTYPVKFRGAPVVPELFFNDKRMTLARWPNDGWAIVKKIIVRGSVPRHKDRTNKPGVFEYDGDRPSRWDVANGVWLHGYWCFDWYSETIRVAKIDAVKRQITFAKPHYYGLGRKPKRRYYAVNMLDELDAPGEYFIDRAAGKLYFWPPAPIAGASTVVSTLPGPLVHMQGASYVTLHGLTLEVCLRRAIEIEYGGHCRVEACTVRNTGQDGVWVHMGERHTIEACDIYDIGVTGITLEGGDRKTLTPAHHLAINNHIHHFGQRMRTGSGAVRMHGVGLRFAHNLVHDGPHTAIWVGGNDTVCEYNLVHHVCTETDDCGAYYTGRNPSMRGNIVRYNFWHHIGKPLGHGNNAVYFDDGDGGNTVQGNVFFRCGEPARGSMGAVFSHGGHDNIVDNNIFVECKRALGSSPWSNKRWYGCLKGQLWQTRLLKEVDITKPPYITRYPGLKDFFVESNKPRHNFAMRNLVVMCGAVSSGNFVVTDGFVTDKDPGFVDAAKGNFALRPDSVAFTKIHGFKPIPFDRIGLYEDKLRPHVAPEPWPYDPPKPLPPLPSGGRRARLKRKGPRPTFTVPRRQGEIRIDGKIKPAEWFGCDVKRAMIVEQGIYSEKLEPRSIAWLAHDEKHLYIAVRNDVDPAQPLQTGAVWGRDDAVEVALCDPAAGKNAPLFVLRGYPDGRCQSSDEAGASPAAAKRARQGMTYAAKVLDKAHWAAEFRIEFAALGIDPARHKKFEFNLSCRKTAGAMWQMWIGTGGHTWDVGCAGAIVLGK